MLFVLGSFSFPELLLYLIVIRAQYLPLTGYDNTLFMALKLKKTVGEF